ncbi:ABC transporter ATP-binding protein [Herbaspirillum seropedicae]|uniref:ABC transporter ATP-binding protein n=1 Tax=Herbaspirillum seropedicae TaxID=964 RepID=UPI003F8D6FBF
MSRLLCQLWQHLGLRRRVELGLVFVLMIIAALAEVVSIGAILPFLGALTAPERVFAHPLAQPLIHAMALTEPHQLMLPLTVVFCVAALLTGVIRLILLWIQTRLSHAIGADFSIQVYRRTLFQPYAVHIARNSSEIITGVSIKANGVVNGVTMPVLTILSSLLILVAILAALMAIQPMVAFVSFAGFGGIYVVITLAVKNRLAHASACINRESTQVVKALQEGLGGIRDVLIDGAQATYCNVYRDADHLMRRSMAHVQIISMAPRFGIEALGMVLIAALAYSLASSSEGLASTLPVLGALAIGAQRLLPVAQQIYASMAHLRSGKDFLADVLDLLDQPLPAYADAPPAAPLPFQRAITFEKVGFRYAPDGPWVLQDLDLIIPRGSRIGFIGGTGSGKSTLLDIVMGLLDPVEGKLRIDGTVITPENHRAWQAQIAHVPQSIFLADTSIAENIAFGVPREQIDLERVRQAARKAQLAETIESMEQQYDTRVGERGINLSGGQRQRIGIARALYKQAKVIVFDEATSALDNDTESAVMEAIDGLDPDLTVLIVAHRLTTLKNCTHIVELADGAIRRSGTYHDIIG